MTRNTSRKRNENESENRNHHEICGMKNVLTRVDSILCRRSPVPFVRYAARRRFVSPVVAEEVQGQSARGIREAGVVRDGRARLGENRGGSDPLGRIRPGLAPPPPIFIVVIFDHDQGRRLAHRGRAMVCVRPSPAQILVRVVATAPSPVVVIRRPAFPRGSRDPLGDVFERVERLLRRTRNRDGPRTQRCGLRYHGFRPDGPGRGLGSDGGSSHEPAERGREVVLLARRDAIPPFW